MRVKFGVGDVVAARTKESDLDYILGSITNNSKPFEDKIEIAWHDGVVTTHTLQDTTDFRAFYLTHAANC